jgi:pimeloyl-ACP methyl ester carboxylesterase
MGPAGLTLSFVSRKVTDHRPAGQARRWAVGLGAAATAALAGAMFWVSGWLVNPPRPRVSRSARPVLGVVVREAPEGSSGGALVTRVAEPARAAGVVPGDRIVAVGGQPVGSPAQLVERVSGRPKGRRVRLEILRPAPAGGDVALTLEAPVDVRPVSPADGGLDYEELEFANPRGELLRGWYVPPPPPATLEDRAPAIAYGHGNGADRRQWLGVAWEIHQAGFGQLLFDFAGRGESEGRRITLGERESGDLCAALDQLARRPEIDPGRLCLAGRSMGAVAAILCAARREDVRGLVVDGAYADLPRLIDETIRGYGLPAALLRPPLLLVAGWRAGYDPRRVRPVEAIRRVRAPVLVVHGEADRLVAIAHARDLARAAGGPVTLEPLPGLGHNSPRPPEYATRIIEFLVRATENR